MRTRRRRVAQGQAKAKAEGRYRGRQEDTAQNARIARMLNAGLSWSQIQDTLHCLPRHGAKSRLASILIIFRSSSRPRLKRSRRCQPVWDEPPGVKVGFHGLRVIVALKCTSS